MFLAVIPKHFSNGALRQITNANIVHIAWEWYFLRINSYLTFDVAVGRHSLAAFVTLAFLEVGSLAYTRPEVLQPKNKPFFVVLLYFLKILTEESLNMLVLKLLWGPETVLIHRWIRFREPL